MPSKLLGEMLGDCQPSATTACVPPYPYPYPSKNKVEMTLLIINGVDPLRGRGDSVLMMGESSFLTKRNRLGILRLMTTTTHHSAA